MDCCKRIRVAHWSGDSELELTINVKYVIATWSKKAVEGAKRTCFRLTVKIRVVFISAKRLKTDGALHRIKNATCWDQTLTNKSADRTRRCLKLQLNWIGKLAAETETATKI